MAAALPQWVYDLHHGINYLGSFGIIVPTVLGRRHWVRLSPPMRAVWWYCLFWTLEAPLNLYCRKVLHQNHPLFHLDVLVETWLLGWAYYRALGGARNPHRWWLGGLLFTAVALAEATVFGSIWEMNVYSHTLETIGLVTLILLYFERWIHRPRPRQQPEGLFYVSCGLIIYLTGSITGYVLMPLASPLGLPAQTALGIVIDVLYLICLGLLIVGLRAELKPRARIGATTKRASTVAGR